ncbi:MAG TPA: hypothetical protein QGG91_04870 [Flavobacteriales bacterium]|jgi:hypothetical protein|nr:hypothetical protein [Flavobacteriales bacterium]|tara:strand:- start:477 stop:1601 length:1125 start_codon:yes stop_codon:yes gene_type:complete
MRKLTIFLLAVSVFFVACETDFEVNASWKEVTVVYGLLDQSQQQQYIKINKAYLGEGDALQMASVTDSSHYTPFNYVDSTGDLQVKIYRVIQVFSTNDSTTSYIELDGDWYELKDSLILKDTILEKDSSLTTPYFPTKGNIIYTTPTNQTFFNQDKTFLLVINNIKSGHVVKAKTNLIHVLNLDISPSKPMGFYGHIPPPPIPMPLEKSQTTVNWYHAKNGKIYQIIARIFYEEKFHNATNTIIDSIDWIQPQIIYDGSTEMHYTFEGDAFVNTLANKITNTNSNLIARRLSSIKLLFTVGSEDLQTYMSVNEPFEGIVQERPVFTNINNGIGLFSCRYNRSHPMFFPPATKEGISIDLDSLYFRTDFDFLYAD